MSCAPTTPLMGYILLTRPNKTSEKPIQDRDEVLEGGTVAEEGAVSTVEDKTGHKETPQWWAYPVDRWTVDQVPSSVQFSARHLHQILSRVEATTPKWGTRYGKYSGTQRGQSIASATGKGESKNYAYKSRKYSKLSLAQVPKYQQKLGPRHSHHRSARFSPGLTQVQCLEVRMTMLRKNS